jgi:hypothetical protein
LDASAVGVTDVIDLASRGGVVAFLILGLLAIVRKWVVPGWAYDEIRTDRDQWRKMAEELRDDRATQTDTTKRATDVAEQAARIAAEIVQRERLRAPSAAGGAGS